MIRRPRTIKRGQSFSAADIDRMVARLNATRRDIPAVAAEFEVSEHYVERIAQLRRFEIHLGGGV